VISRNGLRLKQSNFGPAAAKRCVASEIAKPKQTTLARGIDATADPLHNIDLCQVHPHQVAKRELAKGRQIVQSRGELLMGLLSGKRSPLCLMGPDMPYAAWTGRVKTEIPDG
jgi:hypothetical protein